jgi:hypothetical protein
MTSPLDVVAIESHPGATCEVASDTAHADLRRAVLRLATPVLVSAGIPASQALCHIEPGATQLHVRFDLPVAVTPGEQQALAVRVLDAVWGAGRTYGPVEVSVADATRRGRSDR